MTNNNPMHAKKIKVGLGMCCGCFDMLHVGHINFFNECKAKCKELIVLVDSDRSVSEAKGPTRPVIPEQERLYSVQSLEAVDMAMLFDKQKDKDEVIQIFKPQFWFNSRPHTVESNVETPLIQSYGGIVVIINPKFDMSTTKLINKIRNL